MSDRPSDKPPPPQSEENSPVKPEVYPFGMSQALYVKAWRRMRAVARLVCRHSGGPAEDAVQQAFVKAIDKPTDERPSIEDDEKFIAWLCEVTRYEALTTRLYQLRQAQREDVSTEDISDRIAIPPSVGAVEARKTLERAINTLDPEDRAFLHALFAEERTIEELAEEPGKPRHKVDYRRRRLLDLLYAAIQASTVALVLLLPRKARAFVAYVKQQASPVLFQATQFGGALTVTAVCGVLLPTGSSFTTSPSTPAGLTSNSAAPTIMAQAPLQQPFFVPEVEPEEPNVLDAETNECSAADMKFSNIARSVRETLVPLSFFVAPLVTQVACAGTAQQTAPAQEPERKFSDEYDMYEAMCEQRRARGESCPPRETWAKE